MATIGYILLSNDSDSNNLHACDVGTTDHRFIEKASFQLIRPLKRPKFLEALKVLQRGNTFLISMATLVVSAIDRLVRATIDQLETVEAFKAKGVAIVSMREGLDLSSPIGKAMLIMLAALAELERSNIKARKMAGIARARATGQKLGAPKKIDDTAVSAWRKTNSATIQETAGQFGISIAAVKRACTSKSSVNVQVQ